MGKKTKIEWTEDTWNPSTGCTKVSAGCKFCYAKHKDWPRLSANPKTVYFGRKFEDVQVHPERLTVPMRTNRPTRIFVNSMSDLFHEDIPEQFIDHVFNVMALCPHHQFQVLTKRPERMAQYMGELYGGRMYDIADQADFYQHVERGNVKVTKSAMRGFANGLPNVWLGTSIEDQTTARERIPHLLDTIAAVRWLSCEPLLGPIRLEKDWLLAGTMEIPRIHWIVAGGESGKGARPMQPEWCEDLLTYARCAGIAFFMKQGSQANWDYKNFESFPELLQVREYPELNG